MNPLNCPPPEITVRIISPLKSAAPDELYIVNSQIAPALPDGPVPPEIDIFIGNSGESIPISPFRIVPPPQFIVSLPLATPLMVFAFGLLDVGPLLLGPVP